MGDDPPYLTVGTEVSAKYKGAFCEAKIRKVVRVVKCKVTFKSGLGSTLLSDDNIKGSLRVGARVEARHSEKNQFIDAVINRIQDCSQYTVVFDDGDITTLRRSALCLKSGRHFNESETLDKLPLNNPEHFGNPVHHVRRGVRRRIATNDSDKGDSSGDEEVPVKKGEKRRKCRSDVGKVVYVESEKKKSKDNWFPAVIVTHSAHEPTKVKTKDQYLVRSFKDGRYYTVPKTDATEFCKEASRKYETNSNVLRSAVDKALQFLEKNDLPPHWDREVLFGSAMEQSDSDEQDSESEELSEHESVSAGEEKDRFVAELYKFMDERGSPINKVPVVCGKDLDFQQLYQIVTAQGGYNKITSGSQWKPITVKMGFGAMPSTSTINNIKQSYKRYLFHFEEFNKKLSLSLTSAAKTRSDRANFRERHASSSAKEVKKDEVESTGKKEEKDKKSNTTADIEADAIVADLESTKKPDQNEESRKSRSRQDIKNKKEQEEVQEKQSKVAQKRKNSVKVKEKDKEDVSSAGVVAPKKGRGNYKRKETTEDEPAKIEAEESPGHIGNIGKDVLVDVGHKLLVYYGPKSEGKVTYEAKVLKANLKTQSFLVHYTGWNTRYDEWIKRGRITENLTFKPDQGKSPAQGRGPAGCAENSIEAESGISNKPPPKSAGKKTRPVSITTTTGGTGTRSKSGIVRRKHFSGETGGITRRTTRQKSGPGQVESVVQSGSGSGTESSDSENKAAMIVLTPPGSVSSSTSSRPSKQSSKTSDKRNYEDDESSVSSSTCSSISKVKEPQIVEKEKQNQVIDLKQIRSEMKGLDKMLKVVPVLPPPVPPSSELKLDIYEFQDDFNEAPKLKMFAPKSPDKKEETVAKVPEIITPPVKPSTPIPTPVSENSAKQSEKPYPVEESENSYPIEESNKPYPVEESETPHPVEESEKPYPVEELEKPYPVEESEKSCAIEESEKPCPVEESEKSCAVEESEKPYPVEELKPYPVEESEKSCAVEESEKPYPVEESEKSCAVEESEKPYPVEESKKQYPVGDSEKSCAVDQSEKPYSVEESEKPYPVSPVSAIIAEQSKCEPMSKTQLIEEELKQSGVTVTQLSSSPLTTNTSINANAVIIPPPIVAPLFTPKSLIMPRKPTPFHVLKTVSPLDSKVRLVAPLQTPQLFQRQRASVITPVVSIPSPPRLVPSSTTVTKVSVPVSSIQSSPSIIVPIIDRPCISPMLSTFPPIVHPPTQTITMHSQPTIAGVMEQLADKVNAPLPPPLPPPPEMETNILPFTTAAIQQELFPHLIIQQKYFPPIESTITLHKHESLPAAPTSLMEVVKPEEIQPPKSTFAPLSIVPTHIQMRQLINPSSITEVPKPEAAGRGKKRQLQKEIEPKSVMGVNAPKSKASTSPQKKKARKIISKQFVDSESDSSSSTELLKIAETVMKPIKADIIAPKNPSTKKSTSAKKKKQDIIKLQEPQPPPFKSHPLPVIVPPFPLEMHPFTAMKPCLPLDLETVLKSALAITPLKQDNFTDLQVLASPVGKGKKGRLGPGTLKGAKKKTPVAKKSLEKPVVPSPKKVGRKKGVKNLNNSDTTGKGKKDTLASSIDITAAIFSVSTVPPPEPEEEKPIEKPVELPISPVPIIVSEPEAISLPVQDEAVTLAALIPCSLPQIVAVSEAPVSTPLLLPPLPQPDSDPVVVISIKEENPAVITVVAVESIPKDTTEFSCIIEKSYESEITTCDQPLDLKPLNVEVINTPVYSIEETLEKQVKEDDSCNSLLCEEIIPGSPTPCENVLELDDATQAVGVLSPEQSDKKSIPESTISFEASFVSMIEFRGEIATGKDSSENATEKCSSEKADEELFQNIKVVESVQEPPSSNALQIEIAVVNEIPVEAQPELPEPNSPDQLQLNTPESIDMTPPLTPNSSGKSSPLPYGSPRNDDQVSPTEDQSCKESPEGNLDQNKRTEVERIVLEENSNSSDIGQKSFKSTPTIQPAPARKPRATDTNRNSRNLSPPPKKRRIMRRKSPEEVVPPFQNRGKNSTCRKSQQGTVSDSPDTSTSNEPPPQVNLSRPPKTKKFNFIPVLDDTMDAEQRVALLMQSLQDLRQQYHTVKSDMVSFERKRKRWKRRERERGRKVK